MTGCLVDNYTSCRQTKTLLGEALNDVSLLSCRCLPLSVPSGLCGPLTTSLLRYTAFVVASTRAYEQYFNNADLDRIRSSC